MGWNEIITLNLNPPSFKSVIHISPCIFNQEVEKLTFCKELGADVCINYKTEDFVARVKEETGGKGPFSYSSFKISVVI